MAEASLSPSPTGFQGIKRQAAVFSDSAQPAKKAKILLDDNTDEESFSRESEYLGSNLKPLNGHVLAINQDFANRFEHNKKREERQQRKFNPDEFCTKPLLNSGS